MKAAEKRVIQKAIRELLECVCIMGQQSNNYSSRLMEQIQTALTAINAVAALSRSAKRRGK